MNQKSKIKLLLALILFGLSVVFFALAVQKYQVYLNSRADEGISPTPSPTVTPTPTVRTNAGYTDLPNVLDNSYIPPIPIEEITEEIRAIIGTREHCDLDKKECTGWAWKYVCNVEPDVVWDTTEHPDWSVDDAHKLFNRHCTKQSGITEDIGVTFEALFEPEDEDQVYKVDDVGCGKLVQVDVTVKNCEPNINHDEEDCDNGGANIKDALVYYTGACPVPTATPSPTPTETPIPTETPSVTPIPTETPTGTLTPSPTPTITLTPTTTLTPTVTPTPTETPVPTQTPTATLTPIPTETPIATATLPPAPTWTPGPQATYTPQPTYTPPPAPTSLVINNQAPGITPWMVVLLPIGLVLVGLFL